MNFILLLILNFKNIIDKWLRETQNNDVLRDRKILQRVLTRIVIWVVQLQDLANSNLLFSILSLVRLIFYDNKLHSKLVSKLVPSFLILMLKIHDCFKSRQIKYFSAANPSTVVLLTRLNNCKTIRLPFQLYAG